MNMRSFDPWIGPNYESQGLHGLKIFFLGEAHYGKPHEKSKGMTKRVVEDCGLIGGFAFFTKVAKTGLFKYSGDVLTNIERRNFWNSIAFYNYIQDFPSDGPRVPPTKEMWVDAAAPFLGALKELKPDLVVILGKELGRQITEMPADITFCQINHPSSSYSYKKWVPKLEQIVKDLKEL